MKNVMQNPWLKVFFGLITVYVLAALVLGAIASKVTSELPIVLTYLALVAVFNSIFGTWIALANGCLQRILGLWGILAVVSHSIIVTGSDPGLFITYSVVVATIVFVSALTLRAAFGNLIVIKPEQTFQEGLRFGIKHILILTTGIAILILAIQGLQNFGELVSRNNLYLSVSFFATFLALNVTTTIWGYFGRRISLLKVIVMAVSVLLFAWLSNALFDNRRLFGAVALISQAFLHPLALSLRMHGFRFVDSVGNRDMKSARSIEERKTNSGGRGSYRATATPPERTPDS